MHFNDLMVNKLTSYHMDFLAAFMTPAGNVNGYENMIGNIPKLVNPYYEYNEAGALVAPNPGDLTVGQSLVFLRTGLNNPLSFYFTNEPSIIQATCLFNDVGLTIKFRQWGDLLIIDKVKNTRATGQPAGAKLYRNTYPYMHTNYNKDDIKPVEVEHTSEVEEVSY